MPDFTFFGIWRRREDLEKVITAPEIIPVNFVNCGSQTNPDEDRVGKSFSITRMDFVE